jgi:ABC-2 type transport system permease protein
MLLAQLRNELWKLFGKKRTYIGFGMLLVAQIIIVLVFRYSRASADMVRTLEGNGHIAKQYISVLTISSVMLFPLAFILLPLYVALVGGDLVAKEAEDGTLRMILSRPISRLRLLFVKWLAGSIFSVLLVASFGVCGLLVARLFFPWGGLFVFVPGELFAVFDPAEGLQRYFYAHVCMVTKAITITSLGLMFSCFNIKPAACTILALSVLFVNAILQEIPFFRELKHWFLTYHLNIWLFIFASPVPWWKLGESLSLLLGFNATFFGIGAIAFHARDIKS